MNTRNVIALGLALTATVGLCAPKNQPKKRVLTPEEKAEAQLEMLKETGGFIDQRGEGKLIVVNCQSKVPETTVKARLDNFFKVTRFTLDLVKSNGFSYDTAAATREREKASGALFIVDDPKLPMSMVSMEEGWGMMNVARFVTNGMDSATVEKRFGKQFVRISGLTFGGVMPQHKAVKYAPVKDGETLEGYPMNGYGMEGMQAIAKYQRNFGVTPGRHTVYIVACKEGWAPPPTNDFQKAIWDKVHALPTNPIKIMPETKKVRE